MGRKVNPNSFRFLLNNNYVSKWYTELKSYNKNIKKDFQIRDFIEKQFKNLLMLSNINIESVPLILNKTEFLYITINMFLISEENFIKKYNTFVNPNINDINFIFDKYFTILITNFIKNKFNQNSIIKFNQIINPYTDAKIITKIIGNLISQRTASKVVIQQVLEKINLDEIKGIKIKLSGRLDGVEMAKQDWKQLGNLPLNTLNVNIDYAFYALSTIYGVIGIKV
jgi:small subunit ribosomal protein S3